MFHIITPVGTSVFKILNDFTEKLRLFYDAEDIKDLIKKSDPRKSKTHQCLHKSLFSLYNDSFNEKLILLGQKDNALKWNNRLENFLEKIRNELEGKTEFISFEELRHFSTNIQKKLDKIINKEDEEKFWAENFSAEITSFRHFFNKYSSEKFNIYLLSSDSIEGIFSCLLNAAIFKGLNTKIFNSKINLIEFIFIQNLNPHDEKPEKGLKNLLKELINLIQQSINSSTSNTVQKEDKIFINATGGFKYTLPYLTMVGNLYSNIQIFNQFESAPKLNEIPCLPVQVDTLLFKEFRGLVNFAKEISNSENKENLKELLKLYKSKNLKSDLFSIISEDGEITPLTELIENQNRILPFGEGKIFAGLLNEKYFKIFEEMEQYWEYLWIGDRIPETVEHSRGHTQRTLELAVQFLLSSKLLENDRINDDELFVLMCTLWLHDIGHSGTTLVKTDYNNLKEANLDAVLESYKKALKEGSYISIVNIPHLVRKYHHLLTYSILLEEYAKFKEGEFSPIFGDSNRGFGILPDEDRNYIISAILLLSLYHRNKMTVKPAEKENNKNNEKIDTDWPRLLNSAPVLNYIFKGKIEINLPKLAAIVRFVDGAEVQQERALTEEHEKMRLSQSIRDITSLLDILKNFLSQHNDKSEIFEFARNLMEICNEINISRVLNNKENPKEKFKNRLYEMLKILEPDSQKELSMNKTLFEEVDKSFENFLSNKENKFNKLCLPQFTVLSIISRILFKFRQPEHFNKHKSIERVIMLPCTASDINKTGVQIIISSNEGESVRNVNEEIEKEYKSIQPIFDNLKIEVNVKIK